jgi:hypothetical protein
MQANFSLCQLSVTPFLLVANNGCQPAGWAGPISCSRFPARVWNCHSSGEPSLSGTTRFAWLALKRPRFICVARCARPLPSAAAAGRMPAVPTARMAMLHAPSRLGVGGLTASLLPSRPLNVSTQPCLCAKKISCRFLRLSWRAAMASYASKS